MISGVMSGAGIISFHDRQSRRCFDARDGGHELARYDYSPYEDTRHIDEWTQYACATAHGCEETGRRNV